MQTATTQLAPLVNPSRAARRTGKRAEYEAMVKRLAEQKRKPEEVPAKPALKQETVKLRDASKFVIIFSLPRRKVPKELQVLHQGGGGVGYTPAPQESSQDIRFGKAVIDLDGLMARASVDIINVCQGERDFCRVYVNCTVGIGSKDQGFGPWAGDYERFVRENVVGSIWNRVIVKDSDDKISMELRKPIDGDAEVKVRFAIER